MKRRYRLIMSNDAMYAVVGIHRDHYEGVRLTKACELDKRFPHVKQIEKKGAKTIGERLMNLKEGETRWRENSKKSYRN